jgi:hypothetical protein
VPALLSRLLVGLQSVGRNEKRVVRRRKFYFEFCLRFGQMLFGGTCRTNFPHQLAGEENTAIVKWFRGRASFVY